MKMNLFQTVHTENTNSYRIYHNTNKEPKETEYWARTEGKIPVVFKNQDSF